MSASQRLFKSITEMSLDFGRLVLDHEQCAAEHLLAASLASRLQVIVISSSVHRYQNAKTPFCSPHTHSNEGGNKKLNFEVEIIRCRIDLPPTPSTMSARAPVIVKSSEECSVKTSKRMVRPSFSKCSEGPWRKQVECMNFDLVLFLLLTVASFALCPTYEYMSAHQYTK